MEQHRRHGNALGGHEVLHVLGNARLLIFRQVGDFIHKAPVKGFLSGEPRALLHQLEQRFFIFLASRGVGTGDV